MSLPFTNECTDIATRIKQLAGRNKKRKMKPIATPSSSYLVGVSWGGVGDGDSPLLTPSNFYGKPFLLEGAEDSNII